MSSLLLPLSLSRHWQVALARNFLGHNLKGEKVTLNLGFPTDFSFKIWCGTWESSIWWHTNTKADEIKTFVSHPLNLLHLQIIPWHRKWIKNLIFYSSGASCKLLSQPNECIRGDAQSFKISQTLKLPGPGTGPAYEIQTRSSTRPAGLQSLAGKR